MNIKKITVDYFLHGKTFEQIGNENGVTKQAVHAFYNRHKSEAKQISQSLDCSSNFNCQMKFKRKKLGLSQQQLADNLGTYKSNICLIENGTYKKSKYIPLICKHLDINC
tara:strand:- start:1746 stop:2075 length:330 start_codon:yes stop_codon:yes gene_type:complete